MIPSLRLLAGSRVQQKDWQAARAAWVMPDKEAIEHARFLRKKKELPELDRLLEEVAHPSRRVLSRRAVLNRLDALLREPFFLSRVPVPRVAAKTRDMFHGLLREQPGGCFMVALTRNKLEYRVFFVRTPVRPSAGRSYPPDAVFQVVFYGDDIVDVEELRIR
ncbi:hypothetical protein EBZ80_12530 [bacterium]|nr:hypothetical protein [bacterium]